MSSENTARKFKLGPYYAYVDGLPTIAEVRAGAAGASRRTDDGRGDRGVLIAASVVVLRGDRAVGAGAPRPRRRGRVARVGAVAGVAGRSRG